MRQRQSGTKDWAAIGAIAGAASAILAAIALTLRPTAGSPPNASPPTTPSNAASSPFGGALNLDSLPDASSHALRDTGKGAQDAACGRCRGTS